MIGIGISFWYSATAGEQTPANARITEEGDIRITEDGDVRVQEDE